MWIYLIMSLRRTTPVSASRNKREISIATRCVSLDNKNRAIVSAICHRNVTGWTLVGLNGQDRPVRMWSTLSDYQPFRFSVVPIDRFRETVLRLKPKVLYANDVSVLAPLDPRITLVPYTGTMNQILGRLAKDDDRRQQPIKKQKASIPTFDEIQQLDPTITYSDYLHIYGKST